MTFLAGVLVGMLAVWLFLRWQRGREFVCVWEPDDEEDE